MANNPYVNKVQFGGQTIMDISDTDAEESDVAEGKIFYKGTGQRSVGTGSGGGGSSIQVEVLPAASIDELGKIYQYVGADSNEADLLEDTTNDFVGEGATNYSIKANAIALFAYGIGNGKVKYKNPISNAPNFINSLRITASYVSGSGGSYAGFALGSTLGGTDLYQSPNFMNMGRGNTRVYDVDLSEYNAEEIYLSFLSNCSSGDWNFSVTGIEYSSVGLYKNGYFYKCVSDGESTPTYSWKESPTFFIEDSMPAEDMAEVASPLPSVMSRRFKYSTEEQVVGEWIDGKPIYQKTYVFGTRVTISRTDGVEITSYIDNIAFIDKVINSTVTDRKNNLHSYVNRSDISDRIYLYSTDFYNNNTNAEILTLQYTKTTD